MVVNACSTFVYYFCFRQLTLIRQGDRSKLILKPIDVLIHHEVSRSLNAQDMRRQMVIYVFGLFCIYQGVFHREFGLFIVINDAKKFEDLCVEPLILIVSDSVRIFKSMELFNIC